MTALRHHPAARWALGVAFYAAALALFAWLLHRNGEAIALLQWRNLPLFALMLLLSAAFIALQGFVNALTFATPQRPLGLLAGTRLAVVNTIGNYLPFSGGLIAKGIILKRRYHVNYTHYAVISLYTILVALAVGGLGGLLCTLLIDWRSPVLLLAFGAMALAGVLAFALPRLPWLGERGMAGRVEMLRRALHGYERFRRVAARLLAVNIVMLLVLGARFAVGFAVLGHPIALLHAVLMVSANNMTRLAPMFPGGVGVQEAIVGLLAHLTGIDFELAILAVGLERLAHLLTVFVTGAALNLLDRRPPIGHNASKS